MAYAKVENGQVVKTGTIFTLLPQVSNPKALSEEELNAKGIYKIKYDTRTVEPWQRVKGVKTEFKDGEAIQTKEIEDIPLEKFKDEKNAVIKRTLFQIMNEGFTASNGIKIDIKDSDRSNWMTNLDLMSISGQTETQIRDFNNVTNTLPFEDYKNMIIEAGAYVQKQFQDKWVLNQKVDDATTYQEVEDIFWRKAVYTGDDIDAEFSHWEYNPILGGE